MPERPDPTTFAAELLERFPTKELLVLFLEQTCPAEARFFAGDFPSDSLYSSAARTLIAVGVGALPDDQESSRSAPLAPLSQIERFTSFGAFFGACVEELSQSSSLKVTLVGPTFLEPNWLHRRNAATRSTPSFTVALRKRLFDGSLNCEMIVRNNRERYLLNLREFVRDRPEWNHLIEEMQADLHRLFGNQGERGPRIRCFDPGFAAPIHIFDSAVLIGTRRTAAERVRGGWRLRRVDMVELERERWSMLFDETPQDQKSAIEILREFLNELRSAF